LTFRAYSPTLVDMAQLSQDIEFNVLGCKVRLGPDQSDMNNAKAVVDLVNAEIHQLKINRPLLRDTDVAVLVALKIATEKLQLAQEYKQNIFKLEESLEVALQALNVEANEV
jgi:cell division protein ZapA (FtsZ GTPase activity inhibitor)